MSRKGDNDSAALIVQAIVVVVGFFVSWWNAKSDEK